MPIQSMYQPGVPIPNVAAPASSPGEVRRRTGANGNVWTEVLLYCPAALQPLTVGAPYYVNYSGTEAQNPAAAALAGNPSSGVVRQLAIHMSDQASTNVAAATGTFGWFAVQGTVNALVEGTVDVAAGDYLKSNSIQAAGGLSKDSALSTLSVGIAQAAQTANSAVSTQVYLFGDAAFLA